jgi:pantoate--beta-alanine ligase
MVDDLLLPLSIVPVETVRESDGLAMSSRNRFLSATDRSLAPLLYAALNETARALAGGCPTDGPLAVARERLTAAGFDVDYFALVDGPGVTALPNTRPGSRLIAAARLGSVRLIDNIAA